MDAKKMAAALAAVSAYIKSEEESAIAPPSPAVPSAAWSMSGRLAQTQIRNMMQVRVTR